MSRSSNVTRICAVCGEQSRQEVLSSTSRFGSPDLDLRPPQMMRSTMYWWIQDCPRCGYVAKDIADATPIDVEWLTSQEYVTCSGIDFHAQLAKLFYRQHLIAVKANNIDTAFHALLHAAWDCDDRGDDENACRCRKLALELIDRLLDKKANDNLCVVKTDLLRRAGLFDELRRQYSDMHFDDETLSRIVAFQLERAAQGDTARYTVAQALGGIGTI